MKRKILILGIIIVLVCGLTSCKKISAYEKIIKLEEIMKKEKRFLNPKRKENDTQVVLDFQYLNGDKEYLFKNFVFKELKFVDCNIEELDDGKINYWEDKDGNEYVIGVVQNLDTLFQCDIVCSK